MLPFLFETSCPGHHSQNWSTRVLPVHYDWWLHNRRNSKVQESWDTGEIICGVSGCSTGTARLEIHVKSSWHKSRYRGTFGHDNHQNYFWVINSLLQETEKLIIVLWCTHSQMSCWLQREQMFAESKSISLGYLTPPLLMGKLEPW